MNPRTVTHCPECGAPSLEEEKGSLGATAAGKATPGNAGGSGRMQGMSGTSSTSNDEVPSVWGTKTHTE